MGSKCETVSKPLSSQKKTVDTEFPHSVKNAQSLVIERKAPSFEHLN